jgi:hypothetical protein
MGQACDISNNPYDIFYFVLVEEGRGTLETVVQRRLQTPAVSWVSRFPETECVRVLAGSRNYYIKDLRKIRKRIPFIIHRFQPPYATTLTL